MTAPGGDTTTTSSSVTEPAPSAATPNNSSSGVAPDDQGPTTPFVPGRAPGAHVLDGPALMPVGKPDTSGKKRSRGKS